MAWRSSGSSNEELIANLHRNGVLENDRVRQAMLAVDRAHYAPGSASAYQDSPQPIGHGATISAPHMHAMAADALLPFLAPGARILDIGSGSGYLTHVLANLVGPSGSVVGIDHIPALTALAERNMRKSERGGRYLDEEVVEFVTGDGRVGFKRGAPYDAIHVGAAAAEHHEELVAQLKAPGRLFVPVEEGGTQYIFVVDKNGEGEVERKKMFAVRYVPLTDAPKGS